jgi:hypothetical protein
VNNRLWARRFPEFQGLPDPGPCDGELTVDHTSEGYGRTGKMPKSRTGTLATWCVGHHVEGRAGRRYCRMAVVLAATREYLARVGD